MAIWFLLLFPFPRNGQLFHTQFHSKHCFAVWACLVSYMYDKHTRIQSDFVSKHQLSHITHFTNFTLFCTSPWILPNTESKQWLSLNPVVFWISNFSWILPKSCKKWKENIGRSGYFQNRLKKKCMNNLACTLSDSRNNILTCVKLKWNYGRRESGFIPNWDINNHIAS